MWHMYIIRSSCDGSGFSVYEVLMFEADVGVKDAVYIYPIPVERCVNSKDFDKCEITTSVLH